MTRTALVVLLLIVGLTPGGCPSGPSGSSDPADPTASNSTADTIVAGEFVDCRVPTEEAAWAADVLQRINDARASNGLSALEFDAALAEQAAGHACAMIHYDFFDHTNPITGSTPMDRFAASGFEGVSCGENIAAGQPTPADVMTGWLNSPGHRANILSDAYTHVGIGVRQGGPYRIYWVQLFGGTCSAN